MKENMIKLKNDLKEHAIQIREFREKRNEYFRMGSTRNAGDLQNRIRNLKNTIRHKHIAYCLSRGRTLLEIEPSCRYDNKPDQHRVDEYIIEYGIEAKEGVA